MHVIIHGCEESSRDWGRVDPFGFMAAMITLLGLVRGSHGHGLMVSSPLSSGEEENHCWRYFLRGKFK